MKIDGKIIAQRILVGLKKEIEQYCLSPTLLVILVGDNPASLSYIKQKQKAADFIGAKIIVKKMAKSVKLDKLAQLVQEANKNSKIHGIIVQLPLPKHLKPEEILAHIAPKKDVDGFIPNSPFTPPVALAVLKVLEEIQKPKDTSDGVRKHSSEVDGNRWLNSKFLVIGRGPTAGKPIAETLLKKGYQVEIAHSQTKLDQLAKLVKLTDIVISCVGKPDVIKAKDLKPGAIVIGIGLHREKIHLRGENRAQLGGAPARSAGVDTSKVKLAGDFNEEEISKVASFYTPTPGGLGPINVTCLMANLVRASRNEQS